MYEHMNITFITVLMPYYSVQSGTVVVLNIAGQTEDILILGDTSDPI